MDTKTKQKIGKKRNLIKNVKVKEPKMKRIKKQSNNEIDEKKKIVESKQPNINNGIQGNLFLPKNKEICTNNAESKEQGGLVSQKEIDSTSVLDTRNTGLSSPKTGFSRTSETLLAAFPKLSDLPRTIAEQIEYFKNLKRVKESKLIIDDNFLFFESNRQAVNNFVKKMTEGNEIIREGKKKLCEARKELREYFKTNEEKKTS